MQPWGPWKLGGEGRGGGQGARPNAPGGRDARGKRPRTNAHLPHWFGCSCWDASSTPSGKDDPLPAASRVLRRWGDVGEAGGALLRAKLMKGTVAAAV